MPKPVETVQLQTRREFCAHACQAASVLALGAVAGCGDSGTSPSSTSAPPLASVAATVSGRVISITVAGSALATVGSAATTGRTSAGTFLVARTGQDTFIAVTAVCTHEQCDITGFDGSRYVCPCHGSQYTTSGSVVMGPATRALQQFPTAFAAGVLTFTV